MTSPTSISSHHDLVIVGATPAGIAAAIAAARLGCTVLLLERSRHIGGLPANGLGATDIATRGLAGGLFRAFTERVLAHYTTTYGAESPQVAACYDGFKFEPSLAERILGEMLAEHPTITVRVSRQFDALPERVERSGARISAIRVTDRDSGASERCSGVAFIDATYEGDLAAAAGVPFTTRREGADEFHEPAAGRVFMAWGSHQPAAGSTGAGDDALQAYNFRLCLSDRPDNRVAIAKPATYDRADYASLIDDLRRDRSTGLHTGELEWDGIGKVVNVVWLPNGKTDANNQHLGFVSTDLPEENWRWPTADWAWRDRFAQRLRDYTLGLLWFIQHDPEVPEQIRSNAARFGLAADEYTDNGHFPRQVYVREGRRIAGEATFLAHDALPVATGQRPPLHPSAIAASHYQIDSHAVRKREPDRVNLDGFIALPSQPYTIPYGIMVPRTVDNLWVPVAVSASHLGFGTLRMEPCWMVLGETAGCAAALALRLNVAARAVPVATLQREVVRQRGVLIHYRDVPRDHPAYRGLQLLGVRGAIPEWHAQLDALLTADEAACWNALAGRDFARAGETRGTALIRL